ncbi:MAG: urease accessory protein UreD [Caulobacteraceae bacterium]
MDPDGVCPGPPPLQRAVGAGRLRIRHDGGPRLENLFQSGSAKIRFANSEDDAKEAVLINTAGGMTGGDRLSWDVDIAAGARCRVVTQACEKIYRSIGDAARVEVKLRVAAGAELEWLPQETILFEGSHLSRAFDIGGRAGRPAAGGGGRHSGPQRHGRDRHPRPPARPAGACNGANDLYSRTT